MPPVSLCQPKLALIGYYYPFPVNFVLALRLTQADEVVEPPGVHAGFHLEQADRRDVAIILPISTMSRSCHAVTNSTWLWSPLERTLHISRLPLHESQFSPCACTARHHPLLAMAIEWTLLSGQGVRFTLPIGTSTLAGALDTATCSLGSAGAFEASKIASVC